VLKSVENVEKPAEHVDSGGNILEINDGFVDLFDFGLGHLLKSIDRELVIIEKLRKNFVLLVLLHPFCVELSNKFADTFFRNLGLYFVLFQLRNH
jgi:hypothetical protein